MSEVKATKRILLIDDEELVLRSLESLLRREGFEVVSVQRGIEGVEKVRESIFDLIIADLRMPDLNGIDTLLKIREVLKAKGINHVPEICITGHADEDIIHRARQLGIIGFFYKPFDTLDFVAQIKAILKRQEMKYFAYSEQSFIYKYIVMLSDIDQFKHMSFANYLRLMFLSTDALILSSIELDFFPRTRVKLLTSRMQFKRQTAAGDHILVKINASEIGDTGFTLIYTFVIEGSAELVALGRQTYELVNASTGMPETLPEAVKKMLMPIKVDERHLLYRY